MHVDYFYTLNMYLVLDLFSLSNININFNFFINIFQAKFILLLQYKFPKVFVYAGF